MSFEGEKDGAHRRKSEAGSESEASTRSRSQKKRRTAVETPDVGRALRTVYERAVEEDIPPEMLDLLDRLG